MAPIFDISYDRQPSAVWVRLAGELDLAATIAIRVAIHTLLDDPDTDGLVVDLAAVTFIDSSTVGVLIGARNRAAILGKPFRVVGAQSRARRVLDTMGLTAILDDPDVQRGQ